jgi:hypothetical protein
VTNMSLYSFRGSVDAKPQPPILAQVIENSFI